MTGLKLLLQAGKFGFQFGQLRGSQLIRLAVFQLGQQATRLLQFLLQLGDDLALVVSLLVLQLLAKFRTILVQQFQFSLCIVVALQGLVRPCLLLTQLDLLGF